MDYKQLAQEYPAVRVYSKNNSLGHGHRVVYWVGSDGEHCVVFNCLGSLFTIANDELSFIGVANAVAHCFAGGRLRFLRTEESAWVDAGPLRPSAVQPGDESLRTVKMIAEEEPDIEDLLENAGSEDGWESEDW